MHLFDFIHCYLKTQGDKHSNAGWHFKWYAENGFHRQRCKVPYAITHSVKHTSNQWLTYCVVSWLMTSSELFQRPRIFPIHFFLSKRSRGKKSQTDRSALAAAKTRTGLLFRATSCMYTLKGIKYCRNVTF